MIELHCVRLTLSISAGIWSTDLLKQNTCHLLPSCIQNRYLPSDFPLWQKAQIQEIKWLNTF